MYFNAVLTRTRTTTIGGKVGTIYLCRLALVAIHSRETPSALCTCACTLHALHCGVFDHVQAGRANPGSVYTRELSAYGPPFVTKFESYTVTVTQNLDRAANSGPSDSPPPLPKPIGCARNCVHTRVSAYPRPSCIALSSQNCTPPGPFLSDKSGPGASFG